MNTNYRRPVSRNYSGRNDGNDEIDAALDDLGNFSYLEGIPFELDRGIQSALETARIHMNKAEALLAQPLPSSTNNSTKDNSLLEDIGRVERQVTLLEFVARFLCIHNHLFISRKKYKLSLE